MTSLLLQNEGKTLEFKESLSSPIKIIKTISAFANTAGGTLIIGVQDKSKKIIGLKDILKEEEKLTNLIADSISPLLLPDIEIITCENQELLVIHVPYLPGPHYLKQLGMEKGTFIRLGSTNRLADNEMLANLLRAEKNISFDETICMKASLADLDETFIRTTFKTLSQEIKPAHYESLGFVSTHNKKQFPTYGALLLFCPHRLRFLPESMIRCVCYAGTTREKIIDQKEFANNLINTVDEVVAFIERHSNVSGEIGRVRREDVSQFPSVAVREAVVNALVHADYSLRGSSIQIAVFKDHIEITNPGALTLGQSLTSALSGVSKMRNRVVGRVFRELKIIERLGSGIPRIFACYEKNALKQPQFEEMDQHFRVTLFESALAAEVKTEWERNLLQALQKKSLGTKEIASLWSVTERTARTRLAVMQEKKLIRYLARSKTDPTRKYTLLNN